MQTVSCITNNKVSMDKILKKTVYFLLIFLCLVSNHSEDFYKRKNESYKQMSSGMILS